MSQSERCGRLIKELRCTRRKGHSGKCGAIRYSCCGGHPYVYPHP